MSTLDRDRSIISQVAAKAATDIAVAIINNGGEFNFAEWMTHQEAFLDVIVNGSGAPNGVTAVVATFPGAQVVAEVPAPQVAAPVAAPAGNALGINPNQLSTAKEDKPIEFQLVQDLLTNPTDWYDNRANKRNPKGPDFKHKQSGKALWLRSAA